MPGEPVINILIKLPTNDFAPAAFIAGSRTLVKECAYRMETTYKDDDPVISAEWREWADNVVPQSDNSQDYVTTCGGIIPDPDMNMNEQYNMPEGGIYVPFRSRLFGGTGVSDHHVEPRRRTWTINWWS